MIRLRASLTIGLAIGLTFVVAAITASKAQVPDGGDAAAAEIRAIEAHAAKLTVKARVSESIPEKAARARAAIKRGDYELADQIAAAVLADSQLQAWRYTPFADFITHLVKANDPDLEAHLNTWVDASKGEALPLLLRAQYAHDTGWFVRGSRFTPQVGAEHRAAFHAYLSKALADIDAALLLNDGNPYGYELKLRIVRSIGTPAEIFAAIDDAIGRHPAYYPLYDLALTTLQPKWGGSVPAMIAFVDRAAGGQDDGSPLRLLYLSLYRDLLNASSIACTNYRGNKDEFSQCMSLALGAVITPQIQASVLSAFQLYHRSDKQQFRMAIEPILTDMLWTTGAEGPAGAMLELAANAMHSDTQLKHDKPVSNDFIIDKLVATSWYTKGFYDNALTKAAEALASLDASTTLGGEERDAAVAGIYDLMARSYSQLHRYPETIAYEQAAVTLGGDTGAEHYICYGYYQMKHYEESIRTCTAALEHDAHNVKAHYWRGEANRDAGKLDAALEDLTAVADSEDNFRATAAIGVSMIHFGRNDNQRALDVLNKYAYLYDPQRTDRNNVAVSYNNRCYALMQLGELQKALDDCNASLKYGSLPDAYRKQLELTKRLGALKSSL